MADEKVLLEALSSSEYKVSIHDMKQVDAHETEAAEETRKQFGEDPLPTATSDDKNKDTKSLLSIVKAMSTSQRQKVIELLKQKGLGDPLTKENLVQNAFTVEQTIRGSATN
ncbi:unnamed protein product [Adineta steineri]|uniref:Uncharacterized protein n=1 Tax=Adineta steineri TaxID=433720 RepID=A0A813WG98_9BILA|nr:unnamed protein product [Adineta steineri]CAF3492375.1 unnamed protein product [Adineta steineri]